MDLSKLSKESEDNYVMCCCICTQEIIFAHWKNKPELNNWWENIHNVLFQYMIMVSN